MTETEKLFKPPLVYVHPASIQRLQYPFLMVSMPDAHRLNRPFLNHGIIDAGVERFFFFNRMKDYPAGYLDEYQWKARYWSKKLPAKVSVVIPDYPDDYERQLTWENGLDNVDKTFRNIDRFYIKTEWVEWILPLQARYLDKASLKDSCERLECYSPQHIGIGTVCKTRNVKYITWAIRYVRERFELAEIHAFGLTLQALPYVWMYLDSLDSSAQFYMPNGRKVSTREDRELLFLQWLLKARTVFQTPLIDQLIATVKGYE